MPEQIPHSGYLLLEDGTQYSGTELYGPIPAFGEAVFNTSHSGYQEILSDPSYHRQLVVFTAAHIGNVGANREDVESSGLPAAGAVVRNLSPRPRNWRSEVDLAGWMSQWKKPILAGVDTRALTLHLRQRGAMRAGLFSADTPLAEALEMIQASPSMVGADLPMEVTCSTSYQFVPEDGANQWRSERSSGAGLRVAVLDFGVKRNILCELHDRGCMVTVLPAKTAADEILGGGFHGVLLSNGPGDPAAVTYGIQTVRNLIGKIPIFGICLGHQLLALAIGLSTFKLLFGHRGANHPVRRVVDGAIEITSQNHGFAVNSEGLDRNWQITHVNLNDGTVEGLQHAEWPVFSIQYHPEASPGPHDSLSYFERFIQEMRHAQTR